MLPHTGQVAPDGFPDVCESFLLRSALAVTPWQSWTTGHFPAVFVSFEYHQKLQHLATTITCAYGIRS